MGGFFTEPIVISGRQSIEFIDSLINPDEDYIHNRDIFFDEMDHSISIQKNGMDLEVDIPGLDLSFLDDTEECIIYVRPQEMNWQQIERYCLTRLDLYDYANLKEDDGIMNDAKDSGQMQFAA